MKQVRRSSGDKSGSKMNHCNLKQNAFMSPEESIGFVVPVSCNSVDTVVCPKPRRVGILLNNVIRPYRLLHSSQSGAADVCDSKAGADLLDIILRKDETLSAVVASSPPFFLGSPPSRASNPLAQDARFGDDKLNPISPSLSSPSSSSSRVKGGGCGRVKFEIKQGVVRVEGFNCLNRDSSIPAMA
ncbi:PREDICTED: uncharacterized protein LOC106293556 [Brassica oleracea var. oleracea]|uniref:Uncharacterized protein n=1 Tax=Brassica oleracea var. oleracea TaxID=109376 RepID=A0A0D3CN80_BRAOL|nr:PREDICTED: uncharacterized protein LOC106293556 [Brassica oleracea var. oleracea]